MRSSRVEYEQKYQRGAESQSNCDEHILLHLVHIQCHALALEIG